MTTTKKTPKPLTAEQWNEKHPVGAPVRYWPLRPTSSVLPVETKTRSAAWIVGKRTPVVMVEGVTGGVFLTHVDVLPEPRAIAAESTTTAAGAE